MTQWILSASLVILAVLLVRRLGRDRLSGRLRYCLWALVLLRLLIPGSVGESRISVYDRLPESGTEIVAAVTARRVHTSDGYTFVMSQEEYKDMIDSALQQANNTPNTSETIQTIETNETTAPTVQQVTTTPASEPVDVWMLLWVVGMVVVGGAFLVSNLRFYLRLRRSRVLVMTEGAPVYVSSAIETPCLFGVPLPSVYVTPEVFADSVALRHVLAHELTHRRHGDHLWALLRCVAVTLHWYNPLVWLAAYLSQQDGELACDEGAIRRLCDGERSAYAKTLLDLTCVGARGMLTTATSMTGSAKDLKTRVLRIVKNPKVSRYGIPAVLALVIIIGATLFAGGPDPLEGSWGNAWTEKAAYPQSEQLVVIHATFRDGSGRVVRRVNDSLEYGYDFTYEVKDGVLYMTYENRTVDEQPFVWSEHGDLVFTADNSGVWNGWFSDGDIIHSPMSDDTMIQITGFRDLSHNGEWVIDSWLDYVEQYVADLLIYGEVVSQGPMPEELTYTDYCYGISAVEHGGAVEMILCDGWLYRDGVGYEFAEADELMESLMEVDWEPAEGLKDVEGMAYSLWTEQSFCLCMEPADGYRQARWYSPENKGKWDKAWEKARANSVAGERNGEGAFSINDIGEDRNFLNVMTDGTIVYHEWYEDELGNKKSELRYVLPGDSPALQKLLAPYLRVYADSLIKAEGTQTLYGAWILAESPDPRVTDIVCTMNTNSQESLTERDVYMAATVDGCVVETSFNIYLQDGLYHICYGDGREEAVPYTLTEDTLTLHADIGDWVFERGVREYSEDADLIRFDRYGRYGDCLRLELPEETLARLEALLRAGMTETDWNIIQTNGSYYKLTGLEDAFDTEDMTLTDRGTLHFNNKGYDLTNWEEIEALLGTLYRRVG